MPMPSLSTSIGIVIVPQAESIDFHGHSPPHTDGPPGGPVCAALPLGLPVWAPASLARSFVPPVPWVPSYCGGRAWHAGLVVARVARARALSQPFFFARRAHARQRSIPTWAVGMLRVFSKKL